MGDEEVGIRWPRRSEFADHDEWIVARDETILQYIEVRNRHRIAAQRVMDQTVGRHEAALIRDAANPGWIKTTLDTQGADIKDLKSGSRARAIREVALLTAMALLVLTFSLNLVKG